MRNILIAAIHQKNYKLVLKLLENFPLHPLLAIDSNGENLAHYFAQRGFLEGLKYLENHSIAQILLTAPNKDNSTPFLMAVLNNQKHIVNFFIVNQFDDFASSTHSYAFFGNLEEIKQMNKDKLYQTDKINMDPFGYAVASGQIEIVKYLLENNFVSEHVNYLELFRKALELRHYAITKLLLSKIKELEFIDHIPMMTLSLIKNNSCAVESLNKLPITKNLHTKNIKDYYLSLLHEAITQNSLEIFSYAFKELIKQMTPAFPLLKEISSLCSFITAKKQFHFIVILAQEIHTLFLDKNILVNYIASECCSSFIAHGDGISLEIFLSILKLSREKSNYSLEVFIPVYNLFHRTLMFNQISLLPLLKKFFGEEYFIDNSCFFFSKTDFENFKKLNLPQENKEIDIHDLKYSKFIFHAYHMISLPDYPLDYYSQLNDALKICFLIPKEYVLSDFENVAIHLLSNIIQAYVNAQQFNFLLFQKIFLDIRYILSQAQTSIKLRHINAFIQFAVIFSEYQIAWEFIDQWLSTSQERDDVFLSYYSLNFLITKICLLFIMKSNFQPSHEIKKILLQECLEIGHESVDLIIALSLLPFLFKINLSEKTVKQLYKDFSKINLKDISFLNFNLVNLSSEEIDVAFKLIKFFYNTIYSLKEWIEKTSNFNEINHNITTKDLENIFNQDLFILNSHKNFYEIKVLFLQILFKIIQKLNYIEQKNIKLQGIKAITNLNTFFPIKPEEILIEKSNFIFFLILSNMNCTSIIVYENSLQEAENDLKRLKNACLIAELSINKPKEKVSQQIKNKKKISLAHLEKYSKPIKKTPIKSNNSSKSIEDIPPFQLQIEDNSNDQTIPWQFVNNSKKRKKTNQKYIFNKNTIHKKTQNNIQLEHSEKLPSLPVTTASYKNLNPSKFITTENKPFIAKDWKVLKDFLLKRPIRNLKILDNKDLKKWGFEINTPKEVNNFFACFKSNQLFLLGGAIRNLLKELPVNDFDFIALLSPEKIKDKFPNCKVQGKGKYTSLLVPYQGYEFDVLAVENETYLDALTRDQLKENMVLTLLQSDYLKKDFTINALYWNPYSGLIDFCGGILDLLFNRTLVPIHSSVNHFSIQNAIRILRGLRFAKQFHLNISKNLYTMMMQSIHFLYTVTSNKLEKEYKNLVNVIGKDQANELYHHYRLDSVLSKRLPLKVNSPTWKELLSSDDKIPLESCNIRAVSVAQCIEQYLSKRDVKALRCTLKNYTSFFFKPKNDLKDIKKTPLSTGKFNKI